ncbi:MAG: sphingosine kinase [Acidobacteria bacterium]|nr:MAG: sphingosine kinase [Acidobacteriota bacterium]
MAPYYQRIDVLVNVAAGKQHAAVVEQLTEAFRAAGLDAEIRLIEGPAIAREAAEAIARGSTLIVAAGGDGTVSAAASAVANSGATLAVLPLGTLNHFANDLGIPLDAAKAAQAIAAGRDIEIDLGEVNGRTFINNASIGMYASLVSERAAMQRIGRGKWIAHGLAAMRVWRRYQRLRVVLDVDGQTRDARTPFVFVGNNEYQLSGFELGGRKGLNAGRLHVCMAPGMTRGGVGRLILVAVFGDVCSLDGFESLPAESVRLDAGVARVKASVDGEVVTFDNPLTFRIRRRALRVRVA